MAFEIDVFEREDDRAHSPFGPSSANQWIPCTGRHGLLKKIRDAGKPLPPSSKFAAEGTAAHNVLAECLVQGQDAWEHAGELIAVEGWAPFLCDEEMVYSVQQALDLARRKLEQYKDDNPIMIVEYRVASPEDEDAYGTSDIIIIVPGKRIIVIDFKYGKGIVVEPDDEQLRLYGHYTFETFKTIGDLAAAGGADAFRDAHAELFPDRNTICELYIVQPRIGYHPKGIVRKHVTNKEELARFFYGEALPAMQEARSPDAKLTMGDHCRYCPAAQYCPALHKAVNEFAVDINVHEQTDEELGANLDRVRWAEKMKPIFEREAFERAMNRHSIPGSKLVRKIGDRVWKASQLIMNEETGQQVQVSFDEAVLEKFGADAYEPATYRTPASLEKKFGQSGKNFAKLWSEKPNTGLTLASASDRREAQSPDPLDNFSKAEGQEEDL